MTKHKFNYEWTLEHAKFTKDKGKVFSCFACGGGSTMGYKLAGFDVLGMNEIDPKIAECYITNHNPKYSYVEDIRTFKDRNDLPKELYDLDILDGSPPCSSFSISGNREQDWGKEKIFREGQAEQILDTLFFDFIELTKKLQPKVVIAENVKGILAGEARDYVRRILNDFDDAGYEIQEFTLDSSLMGVPQKRERVFFIGIRKDLAPKLPQNISVMFSQYPVLDLVFFENRIPYQKIKDGLGRPLTDHKRKAWEHREITDSKISHSKARAGMKETDFNCHYAKDKEVLHTLTAKGWCTMVSYDEPKHLSDTEWMKGGSFPLDYDFLNNQPTYIIGMSVPPIMTAQISSRIYEQWISKLN